MALMLYTQSHTAHDDDNNTWDAVPIDGHPWLYVGSLSAAESNQQLKVHNITAVLTVARGLPSLSLDSNIKHMVVEIDDHPQANFLLVASQCWDFINEAAKQNISSSSSSSCLLVHCASGISRSVTAIVSWLMKYESCRFEDAIAKVRKHRQYAKPNVGFNVQMEILGKNDGDIKKSIREWESMNSTQWMREATQKRHLANQIHADVDRLEIQIQLFKLSYTKEESSSDTATYSKQDLLNQAIHISDKLDKLCGSTSLLLPEERVAKVISKSARAKLEGLLNVIESFEY